MLSLYMVMSPDVSHQISLHFPRLHHKYEHSGESMGRHSVMLRIISNCELLYFSTQLFAYALCCAWCRMV